MSLEPVTGGTTKHHLASAARLIRFEIVGEFDAFPMGGMGSDDMSQGVVIGLFNIVSTHKLFCVNIPNI